MKENKKEFPTLVQEFLSVERTNKEITDYQKHISKSIREHSELLKNQGVKDHHNQARAKANKTYGKFWRESLEIEKTHDKGDFDMSY